MIQDREEDDCPRVPDFTLVAGGILGATIETQGGANDGALAFLLIINPSAGCTSDVGVILPDRDSVVYCINAMRRHLEKVNEPYDPDTEYDPDSFGE